MTNKILRLYLFLRLDANKILWSRFKIFHTINDTHVFDSVLMHIICQYHKEGEEDGRQTDDRKCRLRIKSRLPLIIKPVLNYTKTKVR